MSNALEWLNSQRLWSLSEMIEVHAHKIIGAPVELRTLKLLCERIPDKTGLVGPDDNKNLISPRLERLLELLADTGARAAISSAKRLDNSLKEVPMVLTYQMLLLALDDIESRFSDEINFIKVMILNAQESGLFKPSSELLATPNVDVSNYSSEWPTASLEIEEAAKCIALGRVVAAVFHCMRCLEVGIEALSVHLEIEPPTKTSDKTWGTILGKIKSKIDGLHSIYSTALHHAFATILFPPLYFIFYIPHFTVAISVEQPSNQSNSTYRF